jgi:hypothetical protein
MSAILHSTEGWKHWCETCEGLGTIDQRLGGEWNSDPKAECPDCEGHGYWVPFAPVAFPLMPSTDEVRHYAPHYPKEYLESPNDWIDRNLEAVYWLMENHAAIRAALSHVAAPNQGEAS